jgi:hypothetical protein
MKSSKMVAVTNGLSDIIDVPRNCFVAAVRVPSDYQGQINIMGSFGGDVVLVVAEGEIVDVNCAYCGVRGRVVSGSDETVSKGAFCI